MGVPTNVTEDDVAIGRAIRKARRRRGFTLERLGAAAGVAFRQLHRYEVGENRVPASKLKALAAALDLRTSALLGEPAEAAELERLREALDRIATGDGVFGAQALEYKNLAREARGLPRVGQRAAA